MLSKRFLFSLIGILLLSLISLDLWHPHLDYSRSLTKVFDLFYFPWLFYSSNSLPHYRLTFNNFIFRRQSYPVTAELDHDQWQIDFTDQDFQGYSQITLVPPQSVNFFADNLALNLARQLGLITRDRWLTTLQVNSSPSRVYQVLESWNKDVLEKNRRSSDSDLFIPKDYQRLWQSVAYWKKLANNPIAPQDYSTLHRLLTAAPSELPDLVNLDSFARWQAYLRLTNRQPTEPFLLYFNRDLGKFEFVPDPQSGITVAPTTLITHLASLDQVKDQVDQIMTDYFAEPQNHRNQVEFYRQLWDQTRFAFAQDISKPYSTLFFTLKIWQQRPQI